MVIKQIFKTATFIVLGLSLLVNSCKKDKNTGLVEDIDGNVYHTVTIGSQVWMVENLKTTRYRNGDLIGTTNPANKDISAETEPKYQWAYGGNENNVNEYGRLYTWYAVNDTRKLAPVGWHVATNDDWDALIAFAGGADVAGAKLKEKGVLHWTSSGNGTDDYGFKALPGGGRVYTFDELNENGLFWSGSASNEYTAWVFLIPNSSPVEKFSPSNSFGYSVRCVKGE